MIVFGNNVILFTQPRILSGVAKIVSNQPVLTPLPDGYTITNLNYRIQALADPAQPGPSKNIVGDWEADRNFNVVNAPVAPNAIVSISGSTNVLLPVGTGRIIFFRVQGEVISVPREDINDVEFVLGRFRPGPPTLVNWNKSGPTEGPLNIGVHDLYMDSSVFWSPKNVGDAILVASEYKVSVEEPKDDGEYKGQLEA